MPTIEPPINPTIEPTVLIQRPFIQQSSPNSELVMQNLTQTPTPLIHPATVVTTASSSQSQQVEVASGNPCPFLRMLVAQGMLPNGESDINRVNQAIQTVIAVRDQPQAMPAGFGMGIKAVAITGNGISPRQIRHNIAHGVRLDNLRYHIFDKRGNGSRLLDKNARFVPNEMTRLKSFASLKIDEAGNSELGLNEAEIKTMLNANFARAKGYRKGFDRLLMEAEFPVLLTVIGKQGKHERYLATDDIERLFKQRRLPERMEMRLVTNPA